MSVCPRGRENKPPAGKSCGRASLKSRSSRKVNCWSHRGGRHRCRKVLSYFRSLNGYLFQTVRGKKPAASHQMDVQLLSCACRDCNGDISLTPRHLKHLTLILTTHTSVMMFNRIQIWCKYEARFPPSVFAQTYIFSKITKSNCAVENWILVLHSSDVIHFTKGKPVQLDCPK